MRIILSWPINGVTDNGVDMELTDKRIVWPDRPTKHCLFCGIAKRRRFSWFCRDECEKAWLLQEEKRQE